MSPHSRVRPTTRPDRCPRPYGISRIAFTDTVMILHLADGCILSVPYLWTPHLRRASAAARHNCAILPDGRIYWPELRETFSVAALLGSARAPQVTPGPANDVDVSVDNRARSCGYRVEKYQKTVN